MINKSDILNKIPKLIAELNNKQIERNEVISMLIVTFFAKKNMFLLGEPGVSKTGILEIFSTILENGKVFNWTIKNDTKYEELFGDRFTDESGKIMYDTSDSIVDSHIVILDEVWKGNSKILNSLLSAMSNYRVVEIRGKGRIKIPNISTFGASNELPTDISLKALKDRFNVMMKVEPIKDDVNWIKFVSHDYDRITVLKTKFRLDEVDYIYRNALGITVDDELYNIILKIKNSIKSIKISCSDRRFDGALEILKISAYLNNRDRVELIDLFLMMHMIWEIQTDINKVNELIFEIIFGNEVELMRSLKEYTSNFISLISFQEGQYNDFLKFREYYENTKSDIFDKNLEVIRRLINDFIQCKNNFLSILNHYNWSKEVEKDIANHLFLPNYLSPLYKKHPYIKDNINKTIVDLDNRIEYLSLWLNNYSLLYSYNDKVRNKN